VLSDRRSQCEYFFEKLKDIDDCGLYMGGMKQAILKENEKKRIILATYSLAHEGLDIPTLDTLIMATPKIDVIQSCGRIMRTGGKRKNSPLIVDVVDKLPVLERQFYKRRKWYKDSHFEIQDTQTVTRQKTLKKYMFVED
jgi:superfamily II DNA or RNA helicase